MIVGQPVEQLVEPDTMNEKNLLQYTQFENFKLLDIPHFLQTWSEGRSWHVILGWAYEVMATPELRRNYKIWRFGNNCSHF